MTCDPPPRDHLSHYALAICCLFRRYVARRNLVVVHVYYRICVYTPDTGADKAPLPYATPRGRTVKPYPPPHHIVVAPRAPRVRPGRIRYFISIYPRSYPTDGIRYTRYPTRGRAPPSQAARRADVIYADSEKNFAHFAARTPLAGLAKSRRLSAVGVAHVRAYTVLSHYCGASLVVSRILRRRLYSLLL